MDSDDYLDTTAIEKLYNSRLYYDSDSSVCGIMLKYEADNTFIAHKTFHYDDWAGKKIYDLRKDKKMLTDMWPSVCNKLFKTAIIRENNILFKERLLYEDHTFYYEYFSHCNKFSYVDEPLYFYRQQRPNSITTQSVGREKEIFKVLSYIDEIFKSMYSETEYQELIAKISVRLLYERRWVLNPKT